MVMVMMMILHLGYRLTIRALVKADHSWGEAALEPGGRLPADRSLDGDGGEEAVEGGRHRGELGMVPAHTLHREHHDLHLVARPQFVHKDIRLCWSHIACPGCLASFGNPLDVLGEDLVVDVACLVCFVLAPYF